MASKADEPGDSERRTKGDAKQPNDASASLGVRIAVAMTAALVGGAIGGLIFALGVGSFFPKVHVITERWVCGPEETLEAGTERGGHDENYVVCEHGETRVERNVEGRAFWVLTAISGLFICGIVFLVNLRSSSPKRARKPKGDHPAKRKPPDGATAPGVKEATESPSAEPAETAETAPKDDAPPGEQPSEKS